MIRLSVTDLDSYLYWLDNEDMELEELLKRLRGEQEETTQMKAGRAFHSMLEHARDGEIFKHISDGFEFVFAIDEALTIPPIRELKGELVLQTPSGPVTLVGKVDCMDGLIVRDYKLTERFEAERYADSYQWRAYLTLFGGRRFVYDVFVCKYNECGNVWIHDYQRFPVEAYPEMRADVERAVAGLAEIVLKHVPQKITEAA